MGCSECHVSLSAHCTLAKSRSEYVEAGMVRIGNLPQQTYVSIDNRHYHVEVVLAKPQQIDSKENTHQIS